MKLIAIDWTLQVPYRIGPTRVGTYPDLDVQMMIDDVTGDLIEVRIGKVCIDERDRDPNAIAIWQSAEAEERNRAFREEVDSASDARNRYDRSPDVLRERL
jgi:hypothetical protein